MISKYKRVLLSEQSFAIQLRKHVHASKAPQTPFPLHALGHSALTNGPITELSNTKRHTDSALISSDKKGVKYC